MTTATPPSPEGNLATLLCALSFATGIAQGERMEHGLRSAYIAVAVADALGLDSDDCAAVYYGALVKDAGCTACATGLAAFFPEDAPIPQAEMLLVDPRRISDLIGFLTRQLPLDARLPQRLARLTAFVAQCGPVMKEAMTGHCEVGALFAQRLGLPDSVGRTVRFQFERWDGKSLAYGLKGQAVPLTARILHLAQVLELAHAFGGVAAARSLARERSGGRFDPTVARAFVARSARPGFWRLLDQESAQAEILAMAPPIPGGQITPERVEAVCEALADFADLKTQGRWHHSTEVADLAARMGRQLRLGPAALIRVRRAALVHDLGQVAVPLGIVRREERGTLSSFEQEHYRLHPYYTQRVLERVAPLTDLAADAAAHHEWLSGEGYHRQLAGAQISLTSRILSVADSFARLADAGPGPDAALAQMRAGVGRQFDGNCLTTLAAVLSQDHPDVPARGRPRHSTVLTARETEVVQLVAQGLSNAQIAERLVVSRKTVEHHLENIFNKLGVSSRAAAGVCAVQRGLA